MDNLSTRVEKAKKTPEYWAEVAKMDFADNLYSKMEENDVSRADLARLLGVSNAYISKVLNGTINFSIESMSKFAYALGYKIDINFSDKELSCLASDSFSSISFDKYKKRNIEHELRWNLIKSEDKIQNNTLNYSIIDEERKNNGPTDNETAA